MKSGFAFRVTVMLLATVLISTSTGCIKWLSFSDLVSFGAGWVLRDVTMPSNVERQCYQNGVLIDCADLPTELGQ